VDLRHGGKRLIDGFLQVAPVGTCRGNLDESAKQRLPRVVLM
jgi:hypothetical protein